MKKTIVKILSLFMIPLLICGCSCSITLSECYDWINKIKLEDITNVYFYAKGGGQPPYKIVSVYGADNKKEIKKVFSFFKKAKFKKADDPRVTGNKIYTFNVKTNEQTYNLSINHGFIYKDKQSYYLSPDNIPIIDNIAYYMFESTLSQNVSIYKYDEILEENITSLLNLKFVESEYDYIDHTTDLSVYDYDFFLFSIIDENHFSYVDSIEGYKKYKLVEGYSFAEFIDKYQQEESYYTITLMDGDNKIIDIRYDKNISIESEEILYNFVNYDSYREEHYRYLYTDKELTNEIKQINVDSDMTLYLKKGINEY